MNSPGLRRCAPDPWRCFPREPLAAPFGGDDTGCARCDQRRHAVGCRRRVAKITGKRRTTLHLGRADQIGGLDDPGPGPLQGFAFANHGAGRRGADDKPAVPLANAENAGDFLDIDDQARLGPAGAELTTDRSRRPGPSPRRGLRRKRRPPRPSTGQIIEHDLGVSQLTGRTLVQHRLAVERSAIWRGLRARRTRLHLRPDRATLSQSKRTR